MSLLHLKIIQMVSKTLIAHKNGKISGLQTGVFNKWTNTGITILQLVTYQIFTVSQQQKYFKLKKMTNLFSLLTGSTSKVCSRQRARVLHSWTSLDDDNLVLALNVFNVNPNFTSQVGLPCWGNQIPWMQCLGGATVSG